jgi:hypothetical protein
MEPLLVYAPRADVVSLLTPTIADWLRRQLGRSLPRSWCCPTRCPRAHAPRSLLDSQTIVGRGGW